MLKIDLPDFKLLIKVLDHDKISVLFNQVDYQVLPQNDMSIDYILKKLEPYLEKYPFLIHIPHIWHMDIELIDEGHPFLITLKVNQNITYLPRYQLADAFNYEVSKYA